MRGTLPRRSFLAAASAAPALIRCGGGPPSPPPDFEPNWDSLRTHEVPQWFDDAKLGIFVHWGLYSVPGWATPIGELGEVDWDRWFTNNPYSEWYLNSLRIDGSPTQNHHRETFGEDFGYMDFAPQFNEAVRAWDPAAMAGLFREAGARYVVLTTKHHDGFTLWPSAVDNPHLPPGQRSAERDIVGELTAAVRTAGMRMGFYYSGGLDWSFNSEPIETVQQVFSTILHTREFADYADAHWRELIASYDPTILWNDIGYPEECDLAQIVADFYNANPDGLINNRFQIGKEGAPPRHKDFDTPEYAKMDEITEDKWETCRGLGFSFGYNRVETEEHTIGEAELIHLLADIVSKNGNLLLNAGPMADGTIPELQASRLRALGQWLGKNGDAIYGTRPWTRATGETAEGIPVRFTTKDDALYAIVLGQPSASEVRLEIGPEGESADVSIVGDDRPVEASYADGTLALRMPDGLGEAHAHAFRVGQA
ncbi:MAG: alpha-L-fucosidase [Bryobacterales bacterium]|nr:alpha-L-fucosidase [Bryobacterales bacterium]